MIELRNKVIYQVFPRQYSKTHDFKGVINDLDRLEKLKIDYLYLLPIHPIGEVARKGSIGSPYSIKDYRSINKDYGGSKEFLHLIDECHKRNIKVIMDIVFNHTARDSILINEHPEWYVRNEEGEFKNRVGDWSDITDFNFECEENYAYLINTLKLYIRMGVDGFRCDVAPLIPLDFWKLTIPICKEINKDIIFIGESIHLDFLKWIRDNGYEGSSDSELFTLFDALYDYDIYPYFEKYFKNEGTLDRYLEEVMNQEGRFKKDYCKLRYVDNHDFGSALELIKDENKVRNALAMQAFLKGMFFIYNGIECHSDHRLDLFEVDEIKWENYDPAMEDLLIKLNTLKKDDIFKDGVFEVDYLNSDAAIIKYSKLDRGYYGIFNYDYTKDINVSLSDGKYLNVLTSEEVIVKNKKIKMSKEPIILKL